VMCDSVTGGGDGFCCILSTVAAVILPATT
jgi:hypothetical protein